jgi:hypothetical protein
MKHVILNSKYWSIETNETFQLHCPNKYIGECLFPDITQYLYIKVLDKFTGVLPVQVRKDIAKLSQQGTVLMRVALQSTTQATQVRVQGTKRGGLSCACKENTVN